MIYATKHLTFAKQSMFFFKWLISAGALTNFATFAKQSLPATIKHCVFISVMVSKCSFFHISFKRKHRDSLSTCCDLKVPRNGVLSDKWDTNSYLE